MVNGRTKNVDKGKEIVTTTIEVKKRVDGYKAKIAEINALGYEEYVAKFKGSTPTIKEFVEYKRDELLRFESELAGYKAALFDVYGESAFK